MLARIDTLGRQIKAVREQSCDDKSLKDWLDNQEVCAILEISLRTLQRYRDKGILPYSQCGHTMRYKPADVERIMKGDINLKK